MQRLGSGNGFGFLSRDDVSSSHGLSGVVDQDASNGWFLPSNSAQWSAMLSGTGIANPSLLWLLQEASGNAADSIGSIGGAVSSGAVYRASMTGMTRRGVEIPASSNKVILGTAPTDLGANSFAFLCVMQVVAAPAATRNVIHICAVGRYFVQVNSAGHLIATSDGGGPATGSATVTGGARLVLVVANRATSTLKVYTDQETLTPSWYAGSTGETAFRLGTTSSTADVVYGYLAAWFGNGAAFSAANAATILSLVRTGSA